MKKAKSNPSRQQELHFLQQYKSAIFTRNRANPKSHFQAKSSGRLFFVVGISVFVIALCLLFSPAHDFLAGILPPDWEDPLDGVDEFFEIAEDGNAVDRIKVLFWKNIVPIFKYLMVAISMVYAVMYFCQMILSSGDQEQIKAAQKEILWEFLGFLVIAIAVDIAEAFDPFVNNGAFVDKERIDDSQYRLIGYIQLVAAVIAIFYIFFAGWRMVTAHGEEEIITSQKNHIKWGFIGLMMVALSDVIVNRVLYPYEGQEGLGATELQTAFSEGVGVLNFFLAFVGILALIALVGSGATYVLSFGGEGANEKAKKNLISSAVALLIIVSSYILIATFIPPGQVQV